MEKISEKEYKTHLHQLKRDRLAYSILKRFEKKIIEEGQNVSSLTAFMLLFGSIICCIYLGFIVLFATGNNFAILIGSPLVCVCAIIYFIIAKVRKEKLLNKYCGGKENKILMKNARARFKFYKRTGKLMKKDIFEKEWVVPSLKSLKD